MKAAIIIRPMVELDIPEVATFHPDELNIAFDKLLRLHIGRSYFHPLVLLGGAAVG